MTRFVQTALKRLTIGLWLVLLPLHSALADDVDIYDPKLCTAPQKLRFIFIVDNSGSMSADEFNNSKSTITAAANYILRENEIAQISIVQYGTQISAGGQPTHSYTVTVPFTRNSAQINGFARHYCNGVNGDCQDHLPGSLAKMRRDGIYGPGRPLDITNATSVQMFIFTDAQFASGRYSYLSNSGAYIDSNAYRDLGEYFALRDGSVMPNGVKTQISLLYSGQAGAASIASIATVGGSYNRGVTGYNEDPDGRGERPRRLEVGSLAVTDVAKSLALVDNVFEEVPREVPSAPPAPAVAASTYKQTTKDKELFYTLFRGTNTARWFGNVKKYEFSDSGTVVDRNGRPVIDPDTGAFLATSRSFWSARADGGAVEEGGFSALLSTERTWLSDLNNRIEPITRASQLSLSLFGERATGNQRERIFEFMRGIDSIDIDEDGSRSDPHQRSAETLHGTALPVTYPDKQKVVFTTTNLGGLHALDGQSGRELWHYTPNEFISLAKAFLFDHKDENLPKLYGFDGSLTVWQRKERGQDKATLFITQRRGGNSIYAIDISTPRNPRSVQVLWRHNGTGLSSGQSWFEPKLVTINDRCTSSSCDKVTALLVGGGYETAYDNGGSGGSQPRGRNIALLDPSNGQLIWSAGPRENRPTEVLAVQDSIVRTPEAIDINGDEAIDMLFALDIRGRIWRYDFNRYPKNRADLLKSAGLIADLSENQTSLRFLQSLDVAVLDTRDMDTDLSLGRFFSIAIGSGDMTQPKTRQSPLNRMYVLFDPHVSGAPEDYRYVKPARGSGTPRIITPSALRDVAQTRRVPLSPYGVYQTLELGEKVSSPSLSRGGTVAYSTYVPAVNPLSCDAEVGNARLRGINLNSQTSLFGAGGTSAGSGNQTYLAMPQQGIVQQLNTVDFGQGEYLLAGAYSTKVENVFGDIEGVRLFERRGWFERK